MANTSSIQLNEHWQAFIAERVAKGRFDSAGEAVDLGLKLLEREEDKREKFMVELDKGLASEDAGPLDMEEIIREARRLAQRAA
jgi:antitoxin ParD1/3/4